MVGARAALRDSQMAEALAAPKAAGWAGLRVMLMLAVRSAVRSAACLAALWADPWAKLAATRAV